MPPAFSDAPNYTVSQLANELREVLAHAFRGLWVQGEVHRPRASRNGHLYFELVEKGRGDQILGKLDAVLWRKDYERVRRQLAKTGQELADGQQIRCWADLDVYAPAGRLQLVAREIDPMFTLGHLERRRRETLAWLDKSGLIERNGQLELSPLPLRLGLVTSHDSAAYHDFMSSLQGSIYGFRVLMVHASMQGAMAEREVAGAIRLAAGDEAGDNAASESVDAVVVIRGGGSRSDLAAFDSRAISGAIARCSRPVLCGLGHEIDRSIADQVCHGSFKTPTMVAEFLVDRVATAHRQLDDVQRALAVTAAHRLVLGREVLRRGDRLARLARQRLDASSLAVGEIERSLSASGRRTLSAAGERTGERAKRLAAAAQRTVERRRQAPDRLASRLVQVASSRLREHKAVLDGIDRWRHSVAPERVLERGFGITRDADGQLVTGPHQVRSGDRLTTQLADGIVDSRVESRPPETRQVEEA